MVAIGQLKRDSENFVLLNNEYISTPGVLPDIIYELAFNYLGDMSQNLCPFI
jgi:hypothetical protein